MSHKLYVPRPVVCIEAGQAVGLSALACIKLVVRFTTRLNRYLESTAAAVWQIGKDDQDEKFSVSGSIKQVLMILELPCIYNPISLES